MSDLKKSIGAWRGTAMMLNIVLGAGLLSLPGLAVETAGSAAIFVWLVCATAAVPLLIVFGVLGRMFPDVGGLASFGKRAFGDPGYICATFLFLGAVAVGLPAIALTGGEYAAAAIGGPPALYAALLIVGATLANLASTEAAGRANSVLATFVLVLLVGIAVLGWWAVRPGPEHLAIAPDGLPGVEVLGLAVMMVFFAFTGWEVSANLGGEFANPSRDFPLAILFSFLIALALYLVLAVIAVAAGDGAANEAPFAAIFSDRYGGLGGAVLSLASVVMIFANLTAAIWAVSRMVYSASGEALLPRAARKLSDDGRPVTAVLATTGVLLLVVLLSVSDYFDLKSFLSTAGQNFLLLYAMAAGALFVLTRSMAYRCLGIVSILIVAALLAMRGFEAMLYPAIIVAGGLALALFRSWPRTAPDPQNAHEEHTA